MRFSEFERIAIDCFERIPPEFRRGIDGLVLDRAVHRHPHLPDYLTLGECVHRSVDESGAPVFSTVYLYHGSFVQAAKRDPGFDVAAEIEETVLHEVQHHLEDRAGVNALADEDAVAEMNERRRAGLSFAPTFYRHGEPLEEGAYAVGGDVFVEVVLSERDIALLGGRPLSVQFGGDAFEVPLPGLSGDVTFVPVEEGWADDEGNEGDLFLAVVKRSGWKKRP